MSKATKNVALGSAVVLMFGLAACGDDDGDASGDGGGSASLSTTPTDDDLVPDPTSADAGIVDGDASGDGGGSASVSTTPTDGEPEPDPTAADTACGDDDGDASGDGGGGASVNVVLTDGFLVPDPTSADAGSVEIVAKNEGGDLHDLVIVKGDDPAALPVNEVGAVIETELPECDFIGKIATVEAGTEESASFDLDAGSYIIFCNIVVPTAVPPLPVSHFEDGMVNTLTVT